MSEMDRRIRVSYGLMVFGVLFALTCVILILAGVVGSGVWFTVVAMALLVLSQGLNIRARRRTRRPLPTDGEPHASEPEG